MTNFIFQLTSSLEKVLPKRQPVLLKNSTILGGLWGETISFQLAYRCENDDCDGSSCEFFVEIHSPLKNKITLRKVNLVPCAYPCHGVWDDNYLTTEPGLLPDLLTPWKETEPVKAVSAQWRALWIDVTMDDTLTKESYPVVLCTRDIHGNLLFETKIIIKSIMQYLPEQTLIHTEWFHADCLANYYNVPVFSEEHWSIIDHFMKSAANHGINMLLTPVFTPPLDTQKGGERTTVQLVGVEKYGEDYQFDFSRLIRWIGLCKKNGIRYIEISHLFTQWGAEFAPKIMAQVRGEEKQIFGWNTPAVGGEYTLFLHKFIPKLKNILKQAGVLEDTWFHISDEPHDYEKITYADAKKSVQDLLSDCKVLDALSSYEIYKEGIIEKPVSCIDQIQPFIDGGVENLWVYYCTVQALEVSNRFIAMPSARNRILGVLLYLYNIEGFLHWGFNFYNSQYSIVPINPYLVTDAGEAFPSGDAFLVYPAPDGTAYESIRGMVLKQALYDLRALRLLECKLGRKKAIEIIQEGIEKKITFCCYPKEADYLIHLRNRVNFYLEN